MLVSVKGVHIIFSSSVHSQGMFLHVELKIILTKYQCKKKR